MTIKQVMAHGFSERRERGDAAKREYLRQDSVRRFMDLAWVLEARRIALRTAHRRWQRRCGYAFHRAA